MTRSAILTVRVTPEDKAALESLAKADRRPLSQYLELLLTDHLRDHGDRDLQSASPVAGERRRGDELASFVQQAIRNAKLEWERSREMEESQPSQTGNHGQDARKEAPRSRQAGSEK